jgi:hypothetical protein
MKRGSQEDKPGCDGGRKALPVEIIKRTCNEQGMTFKVLTAGGRTEPWCCPDTGGDDDEDRDPGSPCAANEKSRKATSAEIQTKACADGTKWTLSKLGVPYCCGDPKGTEGGDCKGGYKMTNEFDGGIGSGKALWTQAPFTAADGWYRSADWQGHQMWHPEWGFQDLVDVSNWKAGKGTLTKNTGGACKKGFSKKLIDGKWWCCPGDGTENAGDSGQLGEYGYPDWMKRLMEMLSGRAESMLNRPYGFGEDEMTQMFGKGFEKIRGQEGAARESIQRNLGSQGMLGTGAGQGMMAQVPIQTEKTISDLRRDMFLSNEEKKRQDELQFTEAARGIFGSGMGYEQMLEAINSGRRGEGNQLLMMLLQLLNLYK